MALWQTFDLTSLVAGLLIGAMMTALYRSLVVHGITREIRKIGLHLGLDDLEDTNTKEIRIRKRRDEQIAAESAAIKIFRKESIQAKTEDVHFRKAINDILARRGDDWSARYISACLSQDEIRDAIDSKVRNFQLCGWSVRALSFDNIAGGVHVIFDLERPYDAGPHKDGQCSPS